ncbi:MAG: PilZ domain-containing protein [Pseudomonadota bacterium]
MLEKRVHPRVAIDASVSCERSDGEVFDGQARDISIGGMFVASNQTVNFGQELWIRIRLPTAKREIALPAVVRWTKAGGFGVQFGLLGARETHALSEFMRQRR